ncbi:Ig-like domain-containing protein [Mycobacterium sp. URHB0021]|jgi:Big-like domain-containing protein
MSPSHALPSLSRRRALTALAIGVALPSTLASCFGGSTTSNQMQSPTHRQADSAGPPKPTLTFRPASAAVDVSPSAPIGIEVRDGWFQRVTLTTAEGHVIAGELNRDRTSFNGHRDCSGAASNTYHPGV